MKWEEVFQNNQLRNLPFKIELNKWGQIVRSPVKIKHSSYQGRIQRQLESFEYWIVDYLGIGGSRYIRHPKQPTVSIYQLIDSEYSKPKSIVQ